MKTGGSGEQRTNDPPDTEFEDFYSRVSICERVRRYDVSPWSLPLVLPVALFLTGAAVSGWYGLLWTYLTSGSSLVLCFNFAVFLTTLLWVDQRGPAVVVDIREVFAVSDERYYDFFRRLVERVYEPFPWSPRPAGTSIHRPTSVAFLGGMAVLLVAAELTPVMSTLTRTQWTTLPTPLQGYYLLQFLVPLGAVVLVGWITLVMLVFMGVRVAQLPMRLDVTRSDSYLGLQPYSQFVLRIGYSYLVLLTTTGLFIIQTPRPTLVVVYGSLSIVPIVGVIGGNYGLHRAIVRAKRRRLDHLRESHADELRYWFLGSSDGTTVDHDLVSFLQVKREIDALPNWPFDIQRFVELLLLAVVSNLSILSKLIPS